MKRLIVMLDDGSGKEKAFTLTSFSMSQRGAFAAFKNDPATMEKFQKLKEKQDNFEDMSAEDITEVTAIGETFNNRMMEAIAKSLAKEHVEFRLPDTLTDEEKPKKLEEIVKRVADMIDEDELKRFYDFIMSGRYVRAEKMFDETK